MIGVYWIITVIGVTACSSNAASVRYRSPLSITCIVQHHFRTHARIPVVKGTNSLLAAAIFFLLSRTSNSSTCTMVGANNLPANTPLEHPASNCSMGISHRTARQFWIFAFELTTLLVHSRCLA